MGTHLYDYLNSLERMLEGYQELSKEVLKKFGGRVQFNGCNISATISPRDLKLVSNDCYDNIV